MKRQHEDVVEVRFRIPSDYDIPIKVEGSSLGVLIIRFTYDKYFFKHKLIELQRQQLLALEMELSVLNHFLNHNADMIRRFYEKKGGLDHDALLSDLLLVHDLVRRDKMAFIPLDLRINDDDYIDFIRKEGPGAFRTPFIQAILEYWLSRPNAHEKIGKLGRALMEYCYGPEFETKRLKEGRPANAALKALGRNEVKILYKEITTILKPLKKDHINKKDASIRELISERLNQYLDDIGTDFYRVIQKRGNIYEIALRPLGPLEKVRAYKSIPDCIEKDPLLMAEFLTFRWEPNKLAKEIMAKLFNVSVSTIDSVLYKKVKP